MGGHSRSQSIRLPSVAEMVAHLDRFVHAQSSAKRDLATAVYNHFLGCHYAESADTIHTDLERQHVLLLGPTGSGKTFLIRMLADYLGVPLSASSATSFSEVGYVGDKVESLIANLLVLTNGDVAKAERGIVFIDEIDKIKRGHGTGRDVSGEGVQAALLTLLDGRTITLRTGGESTQIDVSKILFICAGAFVGLAEIVRDRLQQERGGGFGFAAAIDRRDIHPADLSEDDLIERCETSDLESFGMIPELIARFSRVSATRQLGREDLIRILTDVEGSPVAKAKTLFGLHGIELDFEREALEAIADRAQQFRTGARGLKRAVRRALATVDYRLPELSAEGIARITVTRETVVRGAEPRLDRVLRASGPGLEAKAEGLRRTALRSAVGSGGKPGGGFAARATKISDTSQWSMAKLKSHLEAMKRDHLDWPNTTGSARKWWSDFEAQNSKDQGKLQTVVLLAEELASRRASITDFFLAYVYSNTDNILANLHYLDYTRLKKEEERRRRGNHHDTPPAKADDGEGGDLGADDPA
ncbi:MAG: hypothetical protein RL689_944 [Planctomycetota bacterium]|jgi:ATP-dependent Clp protease ATP-binding subunit ClpX